MKNPLVILILVFSLKVYGEEVGPQCLGPAPSSIRNIINVVSSIPDKWKASHDPQSCSIKSLTPKCRAFFQSDRFNNKDWKPFAAACSKVNSPKQDLIDASIGCPSQVRELGMSIHEHLQAVERQQIQSKEELALCNQSVEKKYDLILAFNESVPEVLKFRLNAKSNIESLTCQEINSRLKRHFRSKLQRQVVATPFYVKDSDRTPEEKQFQKWSELNYLKQLAQSDDQTVFEAVDEIVTNFSCFNSFYRAKYTCEALALTLTASNLTAKIATEMSSATLKVAKQSLPPSGPPDKGVKFSGNSKVDEVRNAKLVDLRRRHELRKKIDQLEQEMDLVEPFQSSKVGQLYIEPGKRGRVVEVLEVRRGPNGPVASTVRWFQNALGNNVPIGNQIPLSRLIPYTN